MLFGAEPETEGDLRELQARKGQIALGTFYAGLLDEIVVGESAVSAEDDLELVLVDPEDAANVLNAPWVHEVAVDEDDDVAVGREGQGVVPPPLDLVGVLGFQSRKDIHEARTDATGPALIGVFFLHGGYGGVTDTEISIHLFLGHVDVL